MCDYQLLFFYSIGVGKKEVTNDGSSSGSVLVYEEVGIGDGSGRRFRVNCLYRSTDLSR